MARSRAHALAASRVQTQARSPAVATMALASALALTSALALGVGPLLPAGPASATGSESHRAAQLPGGPVVAAYYFGSGDPVNVWSTDLSGARQAFEQMRQDGFNTVALVVPWNDFEPSLDPPAYDTGDLTRLDQLVTTAGSLGMGVVIRLSYATDVNPFSQQPWGARFDAVYADPTVYADWLAFISEMHQNLAPFPNVRLAWLSWEDFFNPYWRSLADASNPQQRVAEAVALGYTAWLEAHYTLDQVSRIYGSRFTSWSEVPTPLQSQPAFRLLFRFMDDMLVHRFFLPAQQRFPGLTLEARADRDLILNGSQVWRTYEHTSTWDLPGTSVTGLDFNPNMRDPSGSPKETADEAIQSLDATLSTVAQGSGGRPLLVNQFNFWDNSPIAASGPHLGPGQVAPFLQKAAAPLQWYTDGYGIWTYRNYHHSLVYNPDFALGTTGWTVNGSASLSPTGSTPPFLALGPGSSAQQTVPVGRLGNGSAPVTVALRAASATSTLLDVRLGTCRPPSTAPVTPGPQWRSFQFTCSAARARSGLLDLSVAPVTGGPVSQGVDVTHLEVFDQTQVGDVRTVDGKPEGGLAPLVALNRRISGS